MQNTSRNGSANINPDGSARLRFTLALDLANSSEKRTRIASLSDLALHELSSPRTEDGEKSVLQTPTPTQFLFPKNVTEEQEAYANGFERALEEIYKEKGPPLVLTVQSDDCVTTVSQGDPLGSGRDTVIVSSISEAFSTATALPSLVGAAMKSRGQFSQCASQAPFGNSAVTSNTGNNNYDNISVNFNFPTPLTVAGTGSTLPNTHSCVSRSQQFVSDMKTLQNEPMSYAGSTLREELTLPMQFCSSVMGGSASASGATVNWPANRLASSSGCAKAFPLGGTVPQIQAQTGAIPQIRAQTGSISHIQAETGTVPSNHSTSGSIHHSHARMNLANHSQVGNMLPMHSQTGTMVPVHSQTGTMVPVQSQIGTMVSLHSQIGTMVPVHSQIGTMVPVHSQIGTMVPAHSQIGTMVPAHSETRTVLPIQSQMGFHSFSAQRTFVPQLETLPHSGSSIFPMMCTNLGTSMSWSGATSTATESSQQWAPIKCEVPPVGAVNMDEQERMKLERKRAKNRVAAQRCQIRKLERIARLEDKAEKLREQNSKLLQTVDSLRGHIAQLKKQITAHANKGCRLLIPDVSSAATSVVSSL